jgi:hypothetical protein
VTVNQLQAAYETIGVAASGQACIIEVKRLSDVIVAQQRIWLEALRAAASRRDLLPATESTFDEQILALP